MPRRRDLARFCHRQLTCRQASMLLCLKMQLSQWQLLPLKMACQALCHSGFSHATCISI